EALKAAKGNDLWALIHSHWALAINISTHGDHQRSLADHENLFPLVQAVAGRSGTFYEFLNSWAIELGEVGKLNEANAVLNVALSSPFSPAYPNWRRTRDELETKRRRPRPSFIAVGVAVERADLEQGEPYSPPSSETENKPLNRITRALYWVARS